MEIPMRAELKCADGEAGKAAGALVNETVRAVTHVVVHLDEDGLVRRLLPLNAVTETTPSQIETRLTRADVDKLPLLDDVEIVPSMQAVDMATGIMAEMPIAIEHAPKGTLVIDKLTPVEASDGHAGSVDAFMVDPVSGAITHVVLREGHFWAKKEVTISAANIGPISHEAVRVTLSRDQIGDLPATPV